MEDRMLRLGDVRRMSGLSKTEIYRRIGAGLFPAQRRLSHRVSVWSLLEVTAWMNGGAS